MNRKKALLYHEMRGIKWFILVGIVLSAILGISLYASFYDSCMYAIGFQNTGYIWGQGVAEGTGSSFSASLIVILRTAVMIFVLFLGIMSIYQFSRNKNNDEFMESLPFSRKERMGIKLFLGYSVTTICCLIISGIVLIIRTKFIDIVTKDNIILKNYNMFLGNETIWHTLRTLFFFWLTLIAVYSVFTAVQSLVSQGVVAAFIAVGTMCVPLELVFMLKNIYDYVMADKIFNEELYLHLQHYAGIIFGLHFGESSYAASAEMVFYENSWIILVILMVVTVFCIGLAYYAQYKQDLAKSSYLILFPVIRKVVGAGIGICMGLGVTYFFLPFQELVLGIIAGVGAAVFIFVICQFIFSRRIR